MCILHREGFPVPEPVAWSRHTVVMELIDSFPLRMIESVPNPGKLYAELMEMIVALAQRGLIHGDFNEFNILVKEEGEGEDILLTPILIDFPQTVSTNHVNAQMYFDRDVACVKRYFERRLRYVSDDKGPFFKNAIKGVEKERRLDIEVEASGFSRKMAKDLDKYVEFVGGDMDEEDAEDEGSEVEEDDEGLEDEDHEDETREEESVDDVHADNEAPLDEHLGDLALDDRLAVKATKLSDFGLVPWDIQTEPDPTVEKAKASKKASGWAI